MHVFADTLRPGDGEPALLQRFRAEAGPEERLRRRRSRSSSRRRSARSGPVVFGDGEQTRDFCYIENAVRANLLAAATSRKLAGEVVNIACGERTSLNQLLKYIGELTGTRLEPRVPPDAPGATCGLAGGRCGGARTPRL